MKINYAYGNAEEINRLVNEYATEHNVQNPPSSRSNRFAFRGEYRRRA